MQTKGEYSYVRRSPGIPTPTLPFWKQIGLFWELWIGLLRIRWMREGEI